MSAATLIVSPSRRFVNPRYMPEVCPDTFSPGCVFPDAPKDLICKFSYNLIACEWSHAPRTGRTNKSGSGGDAPTSPPAGTHWEVSMTTTIPLGYEPFNADPSDILRAWEPQ